MRSAIVAIALAAAPAFAGDEIAARFAAALEPALTVGGIAPTMYTTDEPQSFRIWSPVPPMLSTYSCARNIALAVEQGGNPLGVAWLGVCSLGDELPADLLSTAAARASAAAKEREIAPAAKGLGELVRQRRIAGAEIYEVSVLLNLNGTIRILRTALIAPDGSTQVLVLQYEALRLCAGGAAPLCTQPAATVDALAQRLLPLLDHAP